MKARVYVRVDRDTAHKVCALTCQQIDEALEGHTAQQALRYLKRHQGISYRQLARYLGCHHTTLVRWERGEFGPSDYMKVMKLVRMWHTMHMLSTKLSES